MAGAKETGLGRYGAYWVVLLFCLGLGLRALSNGFVNYDDPQLLLEPAARGKLDLNYHNLVEFLLPDPERSFIPLRSLVFSVCHLFGGTSPWVYHLASLMLFSGLGLLVYRLAYFLLAWGEENTREPAGALTGHNFWPLFAALTFCASPLNVESLAWAADVKDLLFGIFWTACMVSLMSGESSGRQWKTLVLFLLALLSKPSAVMLPVLALAWYWCKPSGRPAFRQSVKFLWPLAGLTVLYLLYLIPHLKLFAGYAHEGGAGSTLAGALKVYFAYLVSFLFPTGFSVRYLVRVPLSFFNPPTILYALAALALVLLAALAWRSGRRLPAFALLWSGIAFIPASGVIPLEILRADRYALTLLPVFAVALAAILRDIQRRLPRPAVRIALYSVWLIPGIFALLFIQRIGVWRNSETLWRDTLEKEPGHFIALNHLGAYAVELGDTTAALDFYRRALKSNPLSVEALNSLGILLEKGGAKAEAGELFRKAFALPQSRSKTALNLGAFYYNQGKAAEALAVLGEALSQDPGNAGLHYQMGLCHNKLGQPDSAFMQMLSAQRSEPDNPEFPCGMGRLLVQHGKLDLAADYLQRALSLDGEFVPGYIGFGEFFMASRALDDSKMSFEMALKRDPANTEALSGLASVMGQQGRYDSAAVLLETLLAKKPDDCAGLSNLAAAYLSLGQPARARAAVLMAIGCDSTQAGNYLNAADIYLRLDSLAAAEQMLRRLEALEPGSARLIQARHNLEKHTRPQS